MARKIQVKTGDVTQSQNRSRAFAVAFEKPDVLVTFDDRTAFLELDDWPSLLTQVKSRALSRWKFSRMEPPMGNSDFQLLLAGVSNTPAYQLFLAGFDIAEVIGLVSALADQVVLGRSISLQHRIPSAIGPLGLFFVPDDLFTPVDDVAVADLLANNKLCRCEITIPSYDPVVKYYIPYSTPIDFDGGQRRESKALWEKIRSYYYAFR